jgi:hypothetical protein
MGTDCLIERGFEYLVIIGDVITDDSHFGPVLWMMSSFKNGRGDRQPVKYFQDGYTSKRLPCGSCLIHMFGEGWPVKLLNGQLD